MKWKKVLYEKQPFPDNYTDPSFLQELQKNSKPYNYPLSTAVIETTVVTEAICCACIFSVIFTFLSENSITPLSLLSLVAFANSFVQIARFFCPKFNPFDWKSAIIYMSFGFVVSPILKSLTESISTDTIYAMSAFMFGVHLLFYDYGINMPITSFSVSLNGALFAAVCLASRLKTTEQAFALMTFAVQMFVLVPFWLKKLQMSYFSKITVTVTLFILTVLLVSSVSEFYCGVLIISIIFVNFIFPWIFVLLQVYKQNINGPWDEAVINSYQIVANPK